MIYKYLSPTRLDVLVNANLRATQANALNDPFELKPFFHEVLEKADLEAAIKDRFLFEEQLRKAYLEQPATIRAKLPFKQFLALSKQHGYRQQLETMVGNQINDLVDNHLPRLTDQLRNFLYDKLSSLVGIVSFSEISDETLMWSHYANNHKGFVIEFDDGNPFFDQRRSLNDEFLHLRPVEYHMQPPLYAKMTDLDGTKLLCGKQAKWSYERERRILVPLDPQNYKGEGEPIHLISFPQNAISAVILGERASEELTDAVRTVLTSNAAYFHVKLRKAHADLSTGQIVISDLT